MKMNRNEWGKAMEITGRKLYEVSHWSYVMNNGDREEKIM